jgi:hypothetical protein
MCPFEFWRFFENDLRIKNIDVHTSTLEFVTIRGYQRMVAGKASDLYASDTYTWSATSSGPGAKDELAMNSHFPFGSRTH